MQQVIVIGLGQLGRIFSGALLRAGCQIIPANRGDDLVALSVLHPQPALVLVAVGEADLHGVLDDLPAVWKDRVGLIQNELLPRDWQAHGIVQPTVISVWFEKKPGTDAKPLIASPAAGLRAVPPQKLEPAGQHEGVLRLAFLGRPGRQRTPVLE